MKILKVLTFSTLFPNAVQPIHGIFVEQRLRQLFKSSRIDAQVVAPTPWFPWGSGFFGRYAQMKRVPVHEIRHGMSVHHPRYPVIPKVGMTLAPFLLAAACRGPLQRIRADGYDFDLIDAHYFYPDGVAAVLLGRMLNRPVIITARGSDINLIASFRIQRRLIVWAARRAAAVIAVSHALKDRLVAIGVPEEHVTVLRNGVDLTMFRPVEPDRRIPSATTDSITLLSVGHLLPFKGQDIVIRALGSLPQVVLKIIGDGEDRHRLQRLAMSLGVSDRVQFLGEVPQERLREHYGSADALVLCSSREGWPNVVLEAMACGTPVIATRVGGIPEVVVTHEAGRLMSERSSEGFVRAFRSMFENYPDRGATRRYAERFGWDATTEGQIALFSRAVKT